MEERPAALRPEILAYYQRFDEDARIRNGPERLELLRTRDILRRSLPGPPATVLDVGGATGVHAQWLVDDGYQVRLIDPVPHHVEHAATIPGVEAAVGDARWLDEPDETYDCVLLLGPLYHLIEQTDRAAALAEARRVARPGAILAMAGISRFASAFDTLRLGNGAKPHVREMVAADLAEGVHRSSGDASLFTTAYFHRPEELAEEIEAAGLELDGILPTEGPPWLLGNLEEWLGDPERQEHLLRVLRQVEREPSLVGASGHLLALARVPR